MVDDVGGSPLLRTFWPLLFNWVKKWMVWGPYDFWERCSVLRRNGCRNREGKITLFSPVAPRFKGIK